MWLWLCVTDRMLEMFKKKKASPASSKRALNPLRNIDMQTFFETILIQSVFISPHFLRNFGGAAFMILTICYLIGSITLFLVLKCV